MSGSTYESCSPGAGCSHGGQSNSSRGTGSDGSRDSSRAACAGLPVLCHAGLPSQVFGAHAAVT